MVELEDQVAHSARDLVADCSYLLELQARGVLKVPVSSTMARRHIGYGVSFLRKRCRARPDAGSPFRFSETVARIRGRENLSVDFREAMPRFSSL